MDSSKYLDQLHLKIQSFSDDVGAKYATEMNCKNGCYRCCLVDLNVFEVEAQFIRDWFSGLPQENKDLLIKKWEEGESVEEENFYGSQAAACVFLKEGSCSIYEARPVICRTQGLPLIYKNEGAHFFDTCPLNFSDSQPPSNDCLSLDNLNLMLSQIEKMDAGDGWRDRLSLSSLMKELISANSK